MQLMLLLTSVCPTFRIGLVSLGHVWYGLASYGGHVLGLRDQESSQHTEVDAADLLSADVITVWVRCKNSFERFQARRW